MEGKIILGDTRSNRGVKNGHMGNGHVDRNRGDKQSHTEQDFYRVSVYYSSLDMVNTSLHTELKSRFDKNDQDVLCALGDVVLNRSTDKTATRLFRHIAPLMSICWKVKRKYS